MPVDFPNPKLFKPHIPQPIKRHFLFGLKYFKAHQIRDSRWGPESITQQYGAMNNCLKKNLRYKKLKLAALTRKNFHTVQELKQECIDGRTRLKSAHVGDLTEIRRILMKRKDLQRKYKSMPLSAIMESCDQETFLLRKENDRLKYQTKIATKRLKDALLEQSKIEDRLQFDNVLLSTKIERVNLNNSITRIRAYKVITRMYQKMIRILGKDDSHIESILDSLEADIAEQQNFIQQIIQLGIPAKAKYKLLAEEFQAMEDMTHVQIRENAGHITNFRKSFALTQKKTIDMIRNYTPINNHKYQRTTASMHDMEEQIEKMRSQSRDIRVATISQEDQSIEISSMENMFKNITEFSKKNEIDYQSYGTLNQTFAEAIHQLNNANHNYYTPEADRLQLLEDLKLQLKYEEKVHKEYDEDIVKTGNILQALNYALNNIVDVVRHVDTKLEIIQREYPNMELKLPLLKFEFCPDVPVVPPIQYNRSSQKLLEVAREKIYLLIKEQSKQLQLPEMNTNKIYHFDYLKNFEDEQNMKNQLSAGTHGNLTFEIEKSDEKILTRAKLKHISAKIVEKYTKPENHEYYKL